MTVTRADYDHVMIPCYHPADPVFVRGKKSRLWDSEGREYVDFGGGIAVNSLGTPPRSSARPLKSRVRSSAT